MQILPLLDQFCESANHFVNFSNGPTEGLAGAAGASEGAECGFMGKVDALKRYLESNLDERTGFTEEQELEVLTKLEVITALPLVDSDNGRRVFEAADSYDGRYTDRLGKYLERNELRLQYDRSAYNEQLINVFRSVIVKLDDQHKVSLCFCDESALSASQKVYVAALKVIFNSFESKVLTDNPFSHATELVAKMRDFLGEVRVCVIQTGSPQDAFILFEVLNDRSLALSDLDLIKNHFYKTYVESNLQEDFAHIEGVIDKVDDLWTTKIFPEDDPIKLKQLVTYVSIVYMTGSKERALKERSETRSDITDHLSRTYTPQASMTEADLKRYMNIFRCCRAILRDNDIVGVNLRSPSETVLQAAGEQGESDFRQACLYLIAADQPGVLVGLVCFALEVVKEAVVSGNVSDSIDFELLPFKEEVKKQMGESESELNRVAKRILQASLLSSTYELPRSLSKQLIGLEGRSIPNGPGFFSIGTAEIEEFKGWGSTWSYTGKNLKTKFLFTKLLRLSSDAEGNLTSRSLQISGGEMSKLQLDHMEAQTPDPSRLDAYFEHEERERFIHGLGNMMPLPGRENISKSNAPLKDAFHFMSTAGIPESHFLYTDAKELFAEANSNEVPTEAFFEGRKAKVIERFIAAIQL